MARKRTLAFDNEMFLKRIGRRKTTREYKNNETIFTQGDVADAMFYVGAGDVKLTVLSKRGKKGVIAMFRQGNFSGKAVWERRRCECRVRPRYTGRPSRE